MYATSISRSTTFQFDRNVTMANSQFMSEKPFKRDARIILQVIHQMQCKAGTLKAKLTQLPDIQILKRKLSRLRNHLNEGERAGDCRIQGLLFELENLESHFTHMTDDLEDIKLGIDVMVEEQENTQSHSTDTLGHGGISNSSETESTVPMAHEHGEDDDQEDGTDSMTNTSLENSGKNLFLQSQQQTKLKFQYKCEVCHRRFASKSNFDKHVALHKAQKGIYRCNTCDLDFKTKRSWMQHRGDVHKSLYPCSLCQEQFLSVRGLQNHMNKHNGIKPHECELCKARFYSAISLHRHRREEHKRDKLTCGICNLKFTSFSKRNIHYHEHSEEELSQYNIVLDTCVCDICGLVVRKKYIDQHKSAKHSLPKAKIVCEVCGKVSDNRRKHRDHMRCHKNRHKFIACRICDAKFKNRDARATHYYSHTQEELSLHNITLDTVVCDICGLVLRRRNLRQHKMSNHPNTKGEDIPKKCYPCRVCDKTFSNTHARGTHYHSHTQEELAQHNITIQTRVCDICGFVASYKYLRKHKLLKHSIPDPESKSGLSTPRKRKPQRCFACRVCGKKFTNAHARGTHYHSHSQEELSQHKVTIKTRVCEICGFVASYQYLDRHKLLKHNITTSDIKTNFVCETCGREFDYEERYKNHVNKHKYVARQRLKRGLPNGYPCLVCDKIFAVRIDLLEHAQIHHCTDNEFNCNTCGRKFSLFHNLERHISAVHKKIKKFKCDFCDKSFSTKRGRDVHVNIHTGHKPYECNKCGLKFSDSSTLYKHRARHEKKL